MYKLILFFLLSLLFLMMYSLQTDEEVAIHTLFQGKHALDRAVHAAAQQLDQQKLRAGIHSIDVGKANSEARKYLENNLHLDAQLKPLPGTFLKAPVRILDFTVINEEKVFPYTYVNSNYSFQVTLQHPGVVMIIQLDYPSIYHVLDPISWKIKSSDELVY